MVVRWDKVTAMHTTLCIMQRARAHTHWTWFACWYVEPAGTMVGISHHCRIVCMHCTYAYFCNQIRGLCLVSFLINFQTALNINVRFNVWMKNGFFYSSNTCLYPYCVAVLHRYNWTQVYKFLFSLLLLLLRCSSSFFSYLSLKWI